MLYKKNSKLSETENLKPFKSCRRPESNRHGRLVPQDFKSCASASSATAASMADSPNGAYRARTYDPLLVRQMLSQLS